MYVECYTVNVYTVNILSVRAFKQNGWSLINACLFIGKAGYADCMSIYYTNKNNLDISVCCMDDDELWMNSFTSHL